MIMTLEESAGQVWTTIDNLFFDNKASHALALDDQFHNNPQGNMTVHESTNGLSCMASLWLFAWRYMGWSVSR
jgi:hypothetical protein